MKVKYYVQVVLVQVDSRDSELRIEQATYALLVRIEVGHKLKAPAALFFTHGKYNGETDIDPRFVRVRSNDKPC